jgi:membrane protein DedA with SNARE-associated domain
MLEASLMWILAYRYWVLLPLTIIEGPVVMLFCGFIVRLGGLELIPTYFLLMAGDFVGDILWYGIGRYGARSLLERFGYFLSVSLADIDRFERLFRKYSIKILFISKITMGFGFALATLMAAGAAHTPFRKYALINILGGFIWTGLLMAVGYFFGNAYLAINTGLRDVLLVALLISAFFALRGVNRYLRKRFSSL